jgi:predicted ester cyclase
MSERNVALVRRLWDEVYNRANGDVLGELVAPDAVFYNPIQPARGLAEIRQAILGAHAKYARIRWALLDVFATAERVAARWQGQGKDKTSGRHFTYTGITVYEIVDGKIAVQWGEGDFLGLKRQLGELPPEQPAVANRPGEGP